MPSVNKQTPTDKPMKKTGGLFDKLVDVADAAKSGGLKMAVVGRSGSGKTTLASTFPKPLLQIVCSNSAAGETLSISNVPGIKVHTVEDEKELTQLIKEQRQTNYFETVVLDHISAYSDLSMRQILADRGRTSPITADWQDLNAQLKERISDLLKLKCNVLINSQERVFGTNENGDATEILTPSVSFALSPGVAGWMAPAVDYMMYAFVRMGKIKTGEKIEVAGKQIDAMREKGIHCLRLTPHAVYNTKFRVPRGTEIPDVMENPTYDKLIKLIRGNK